MSDTASKDNNGKPKLHLIPVEPLILTANVYEYGCEKYAPYDWMKGMPWSESYQALLRHACSFWNGEIIDKESKCHHMAAVAFHANSLMYYTLYHSGYDDRPKGCCPTKKIFNTIGDLK